MALMILLMPSLAVEISPMAVPICSMDWPDFSTRRWVSSMIWRAWAALSAFWLVMEAISSRLAEVSSRLAACWLAPSASFWERVRLLWEKVSTCSTVRPRESTAWRRGRKVLRSR